MSLDERIKYLATEKQENILRDLSDRVEALTEEMARLHARQAEIAKQLSELEPNRITRRQSSGTAK